MDFISILHGDVLLAKQRLWEGHKSGQLCGQVVEFMSVYGTIYMRPGWNTEHTLLIDLIMIPLSFVNIRVSK